MNWNSIIEIDEQFMQLQQLFDWKTISIWNSISYYNWKIVNSIKSKNTILIWYQISSAEFSSINNISLQ